MRRPFIATGKQLGEGMFGVVMSGTAKGLVPGEPSTRVAVKHLSDESRFFFSFLFSPFTFVLSSHQRLGFMPLSTIHARVCVRACMHAYVRACVFVCLYFLLSS